MDMRASFWQEHRNFFCMVKEKIVSSSLCILLTGQHRKTHGSRCFQQRACIIDNASVLIIIFEEINLRDYVS